MRLNLLPALLGEAYAHLHQCLCASGALARKLFLMPFHRDVQPAAALLAAMQSALEHCKQVGGASNASPSREGQAKMEGHLQPPGSSCTACAL